MVLLAFDHRGAVGGGGGAGDRQRVAVRVAVVGQHVDRDRRVGAVVAESFDRDGQVVARRRPPRRTASSAWKQTPTGVLEVYPWNSNVDCPGAAGVYTTLTCCQFEVIVTVVDFEPTCEPPEYSRIAQFEASPGRRRNGPRC